MPDNTYKKPYLINIQFVVMHRTFFDDYREYAQKIADTLLNEKKDVPAIQNIGVLPDEYLIYNIEDSSGFRFSISKRRTDIFLFANDVNIQYDIYINKFVEKINSYINLFDDLDLISRIGLTSNSFIEIENNIKYIQDNYLKVKINKPYYCNIAYTCNDNYESMKINKAVSVYTQIFQNQKNKNEVNAIGIKLDINTEGWQKKIELKKIKGFIKRYSKYFLCSEIDKLIKYGIN